MKRPDQRLLAFAVAFAMNWAWGAAAQTADDTRGVHIIDEQPLPDLSQTKVDNGAGVNVAILPGADLEPGTKVSFEISTKKPGYLILVDVDPSGKLTQIYPNRRSLVALGARENANLIKPGRAVTIPDSTNPYAGFEFLVEPPLGTAMVVAILCDRPVHLLDLPDVPPPLAGHGDAVSYLYSVAHDLRITASGESGKLEEANWSFDAKFYVIK
jgi:hypothetical protein